MEISNGPFLPIGTFQQKKEPRVAIELFKKACFYFMFFQLVLKRFACSRFF
jgi:hypothetical protein